MHTSQQIVWKEISAPFAQYSLQPPYGTTPTVASFPTLKVLRLLTDSPNPASAMAPQAADENVAAVGNCHGVCPGPTCAVALRLNAMASPGGPCDSHPWFSKRSHDDARASARGWSQPAPHCFQAADFQQMKTLPKLRLKGTRNSQDERLRRNGFSSRLLARARRSGGFKIEHYDGGDQLGDADCIPTASGDSTRDGDDNRDGDSTRTDDGEPLSPTARFYRCQDYSDIVTVVVFCDRVALCEMKELVRGTLCRHPRFRSYVVSRSPLRDAIMIQTLCTKRLVSR